MRAFSAALGRLKYFRQFFRSPLAWQLIRNTLVLSFYSLLAGFPTPLILALALNQVRRVMFKKTVQMVTYAPYFISTVVMVGIIIQYLHPRFGLVNSIMELFGVDAVNFMGKSRLFSSIYVWTGVWQYTGYSAIIYIAALSSIDQEQIEAAIIDGASLFQRVIFIEIPGIAPTIIILLIISVGQIMDVGFEKVFLMQNPLNLGRSEIMATYIYKIGLVSAQYSFSTAISFFNSIVNFLLIITVNEIAKRVGETSLW